MAQIAFIVGNDFEDVEFQTPYNRLVQAGHNVDIIGASANSELHGKRGNIVTHTDYSALDRNPDDYDAVVIPGGYGPDHLRTNHDIVAFIREFIDTDKPVAAICHGPQLLIEAAAVKGMTLTSWPSIKTDLLNAGATWVDKAVVQDHNLITSRKPDDLSHFCNTIERMLEINEQLTEQTLDKHQTPDKDTALDDDGFLLDPAQWDENLARQLASQEGIAEMNEARWQVIYALRNYYAEHHHLPDFQKLCTDAKQNDPYCMEKLFFNDGSKAWRIAGLPNPGEEVKSYL